MFKYSHKWDLSAQLAACHTQYYVSIAFIIRSRGDNNACTEHPCVATSSIHAEPEGEGKSRLCPFALNKLYPLRALLSYLCSFEFFAQLHYVTADKKRACPCCWSGRNWLRAPEDACPDRFRKHRSGENIQARSALRALPLRRIACQDSSFLLKRAA